MTTVLLIIHLFVTLALIGVVLIQRSEGGGLGIGSSQGMGVVHVRPRHRQPADPRPPRSWHDLHGAVADPGAAEPRHGRRRRGDLLDDPPPGAGPGAPPAARRRTPPGRAAPAPAVPTN